LIYNQIYVLIYIIHIILNQLRKHIIKITFLFIIIFAILNSTYLYAKKTENSWLGMTTEEKKILIKNKIRLIIERKKLEEKERKKEEKIRKIKEKIKEISMLRKIELKSALEFPVNLDVSSNLKHKRIQERSLSCELSATSDIVAYFINRKVTESYIIKQVDKSFYNKALQIVDNKKIWWNPNLWYVWYIDKLPDWSDAKQYNATWYWVLEKPIAKIYKKLGFKIKVLTNKDYKNNYNKKWHLSELLKSLSKWSMVQLWWDYCTTPKYEDTDNRNTCKKLTSSRKLEWYYEENWKLIKHTWLVWEHAFYLLWYSWWVENPTHIIVWDTKTGKHKFPIKEWYRKWDKMQNRSIIIYGK